MRLSCSSPPTTPACDVLELPQYQPMHSKQVMKSGSGTAQASMPIAMTSNSSWQLISDAASCVWHISLADCTQGMVLLKLTPAPRAVPSTQLRSLTPFEPRTARMHTKALDRWQTNEDVNVLQIWPSAIAFDAKQHDTNLWRAKLLSCCTASKNPASTPNLKPPLHACTIKSKSCTFGCKIRLAHVL